MNEDRKKRGLANGKFFTAVAICALQEYTHPPLSALVSVPSMRFQ